MFSDLVYIKLSEGRKDQEGARGQEGLGRPPKDPNLLKLLFLTI